MAWRVVISGYPGLAAMAAFAGSGPRSSLRVNTDLPESTPSAATVALDALVSGGGAAPSEDVLLPMVAALSKRVDALGQRQERDENTILSLEHALDEAELKAVFHPTNPHQRLDFLASKTHSLAFVLFS